MIVTDDKIFEMHTIYGKASPKKKIFFLKLTQLIMCRLGENRGVRQITTTTTTNTDDTDVIAKTA